MKLKIWGVRGSIPTPGPQTIKYGGNTTCLEIQTEQSTVIIDAGSGIRELGDALLREHQNNSMSIHLFFTHAHWDHIQGFPFFGPAYRPGNSIAIYGSQVTGKSIKKILEGQVQYEYFPIPITDMAAKLNFQNISGPVDLDGCRVDSYYVNHPGNALAYKCTSNDSSIVFTGDHETYSRSPVIFNEKDRKITPKKLKERFSKFCQGVDIFVVDASYTEKEYQNRKGWGHSTNIDAANLAMDAQAKTLVLTHHNPLHTDQIIDKILAETREYLKSKDSPIKCVAASEGLILTK